MWKERPKDFARTNQGIQYALVMQATGKSAAEVHNMNEWDRHLTALLQARFYKERSGDGGGQQKP